jgi:hypothetical protein
MAIEEKRVDCSQNNAAMRLHFLYLFTYPPLLITSHELPLEPSVTQIFKLSQGEFVVPDKIEAAYQNLDLISQIYVYGDSTQSRLLAVVVPEEAVFLGAAASKGLSGTFREMVADPRAQAWVLEEMTAQARKSGLQVSPYEHEHPFDMVLLSSIPYRL